MRSIISKIWRVAALSSLLGGALADTDVQLPALAQGLDNQSFTACQSLQETCVKQYSSAQMPERIACVRKALTTQAVCQQSLQLEEYTGVLPTDDQIHHQGRVTWFSVFYPADGQTGYFLLDSTGRLLSLASSQNSLIRQSALYQQSMQPYPNGALQSLVTTSPADTPSAIRTQQDGAVQLVFNQWLKKMDCVACENLAQAEVAYYFDAQGRYVSVQLAAIKPLKTP